MPVIARIPRLEPGGEVARDDAAPRVDDVADAPTEAIDVRPPARGDRRGEVRASRALRFPVVTTLLLAAVAAACWLAVWRQERRHESIASTMPGTPPESMPESAHE